MPGEKVQGMDWAVPVYTPVTWEKDFTGQISLKSSTFKKHLV